MRIIRSREELAHYASDNDIHGITGIMLECHDLDVSAASPGDVWTKLENDDVKGQSPWGIRNWGADSLPLDQFIDQLNPDCKDLLIKFAEDCFQAQIGSQSGAVSTEDKVKTLLKLFPGQFRFNEAQNTVTDIRHARLIRRMDLTEWVSIPYKDILYWVVTDDEGDKWRFPLGRITVWIRGGAQVDHTRTKTAKSFVRGEIAQQMSERDFDTSLEGIQRVFFDVNAEDAFSTNWGNC